MRASPDATMRTRGTSRPARATRLARLLVAGGALAAGLAGCDDRTPTDPGPPAPAEARVAFASDRDGDPEIYTMRGDGTDVRRLTRDPAADRDPAWAPDRRRLAFVSDRDGNPEVYVMDADGSGVRRVTDDPATDGSPAWAPDGRRLVFASDRTGADQLHVVDVDAGVAGGAVQLTADVGGARDPAWSPDGARIAYVRWDGMRQVVHLIGADGTGAAPLDTTEETTGNTSAERTMERAPAWSPDGRWIAFAAARTDPAPPGSREDQIYVTRADGTGRRRLTEPPAGDVTTFATDPTWSPDGRRIVFTSNRGGGPPELHAMAPDGSGVVRLTRAPATFFTRPAWSPDGTLIAMLGSPEPHAWLAEPPQAPGVFVVRPDGSGLRRILGRARGAASYGIPVWSPDGRRLAVVARTGSAVVLVVAADGGDARLLAGVSPSMSRAPLWSPDGRRIAVVGDAGSPGIHVARADGGPWTEVGGGVAPTSGPLWSPDGSELAFTARFAGDAAPRLYVADPAAGAPTPLGTSDGAWTYLLDDWSPDGATLLLTGSPAADGAEPQLFALARSTGVATQLTGGAAETGHAWGGRWAPDGLTIAFIGGFRGPGFSPTATSDVFVIGADGSGRRQLSPDGALRYSAIHWSPDGSRVAAEARFIHGGLQSYVPILEVDGPATTPQQPVPSVTCSNAAGASWSPSGGELVYACAWTADYGPGNAWFTSYVQHELVVRGVENGRARMLTHGSPTFSGEPAWTP